MKALVLILSLLFAFNTFGAEPCKNKSTVFRFNLPVFLGNKIFNDQVTICKEKGVFSGTLIVPKRFTSQLENIQLKGNNLSFSITANEGRGTFRVFYKGQLHNNSRHFLGMARLENNKLLGPFIGIASDKKMTFEIIQE